ncbi:DNA-binding transcriptional LysR family regulator [Pelomonas saccharophila]|uniref:DNA-binding transcriptional LysR family regulator n=1 Tax=Roseateles saccharophilus TaxID=304 RepID=A0ABU1YQJ0_ROSSA|nr:LysR family transcriptional regulator [Roseateles saccharophilus]MDR7271003.1 DNA-binding transcriptional LysR family regulator [Roseateles saccharophilus]
MDRLTATRVFVTVVEQGSLTQAAERLDMSTAMVSRYLAAMEAWLGARLLHRTTRRLSLTEAGQSALASCRQLLDLSEDVAHQAGAARREPSGRLRITCSPSFAEAQLAPALIDFQRLHPQVAFSLTVADRSVDLAAEGIDLAVRITNSLEPTLITRPLGLCRSVLCASPGYLAERGRPETLQALQAHRCLAHAFVSAAQYRFRHAGQIVELPITDVLSTNDAAVLRRAVLAGGGLAILPTYFVGEDLRSGRLIGLLPDYEPEPLGVHAVFLSRQHQPLALRLLVDFLAERFGGDTPPWDRVS